MLMSMGDRQHGPDGDAGVITDVLPRPDRKLKKPKLYKVLLHNDDYTTMEFVVFILQGIFRRSEAEAVEIMLHVHRNGIGVAGVYIREIAETRVAQVDALAREHEFPLLCTMEET
jgi:ATP-dependent Clp protease adaptor protein ClpS